jgi:hypothetical protein
LRLPCGRRLPAATGSPPSAPGPKSRLMIPGCRGPVAGIGLKRRFGRASGGLAERFIESVACAAHRADRVPLVVL